MSPIEKRKVSYDFLNHTWNVYTRSTSPGANKKMIYWGAAQVPLPISLHRGPSSSSQAHIPMQAHLQFGAGKPILGPLIGILTSAGKNGSFMGVKSNFIDIIQTGNKQGAIIFVFTPEQIDWEKGTIGGYLYHPRQKNWKKGQFPFPNVVYNRIPVRRLEQQEHVRSSIQRLQKIKGLTLFNPHFFKKDDLFRLLQRSRELSPYLPLTVQLQHKHELQEMLRKTQHVYLKPTEGKAGTGIMKVESHPDQKEYRLLIQPGKNPRTLRTRNFGQIWKWFRQYRNDAPYLMQKAVSLAKVDRNPFDFRALVQKDHTGQWQVTGLGVRVAGENRITTHVPRGGRIEHPEKVLQQIYTSHQAAGVQAQIKRLALAIAHELEQHYGHLGEMSMDIGLDQQGDLWFFEANAKPMKFDEPVIRRHSLQNLIGYAYYLTFIQARKGVRHDTLVKAN